MSTENTLKDAVKLPAAPVTAAAPAKNAVAKKVSKPAGKAVSKKAAAPATKAKTAATKVAKPVAKKAGKKVAKKAASTVATKTVTKKVAPKKAAAKKVTAKKPLAKNPTTKPATKAAGKSVVKAPQVSKPVALPKEKVKKAKLVRDSFTMPEVEYQVLSDVKKAFLKSGVSVKKSELLRAGVALIKTLDLSKLNAVISALAPIKAGRPKNDK